MSIFSSGGHFVHRSETVWANLAGGHMCTCECFYFKFGTTVQEEMPFYDFFYFWWPFRLASEAIHPRIVCLLGYISAVHVVAIATLKVKFWNTLTCLAHKFPRCNKIKESSIVTICILIVILYSMLEILKFMILNCTTSGQTLLG